MFIEDVYEYNKVLMVARNLFKQCRGGGSGRHAVFPNKTELNTNVLVHGVRLFLHVLII